MLALLITGLGLFGLASYTAERRTKEIGIRKVMGASAPIPFIHCALNNANRFLPVEISTWEMAEK